MKLKSVLQNLKHTFHKCIANFGGTRATIKYLPHINVFTYRSQRLVLPANSYQAQVAQLIWSDPTKIWDSADLIWQLFKPEESLHQQDQVDHKRLYDAIRLANIKANQKLGLPIIVSCGKAWQANTNQSVSLFAS